MRTLVLSTDPGIPLFGPSGASAHLRGVARALGRRGDVVGVAVPLSSDVRGIVDDPVSAELLYEPPQLRRWLPNRFQSWAAGYDADRFTQRAVREFRPDRVWQRHALWAIPPKFDGMRLLEVNAPLTLERQRFGGLRRAAAASRRERQALLAADRVLAVSQWLVEWAIGLGCDPAKVVHLPNGVDPRPLGDREFARRQLGLQGLVVGFLGTMKPWHGIERLPAILDQLPEAIGVVIGDGPVEVPRHPRLIALGRQAPEALPGLIASFDVGLAPYRQDAPPWFCPLKLLEYRQQGVPFVSAAIGDAPLLAANGAGICLNTDDPAVWAEQIRTVVANFPRIVRSRPWDDVIEAAIRP